MMERLAATEHTQVNTNDLALDLLLTTFGRVPSPERSGGSSEGRQTGERGSPRKLESEASQCQIPTGQGFR